MEKEDKIREEVNKTLKAFNQIKKLEGNPYLFTRIQSEIEIIQAKDKRYGFKAEFLRPVILFLILIMNIFTAVFFLNSKNEKTSTKQTYFFTNILIIILVIVNIGSLSFIWFREANRPPSPPLPPNSPDHENVTRFLDKELDLNESQEQKFDRLRKEHFKTTKNSEDKIAAFKKSILTESFKQNPDTQKIVALADSIGSLQKRYEIFLSEHFQKLASICRPKQREKLKDIFLSSFGPKNKPPMPPPPGGRNLPPVPPESPH
ncbi:MAG: periplasmic heavy metal sensor [Ignavibacteriaceae bacterium]